MRAHGPVFFFFFFVLCFFRSGFDLRDLLPLLAQLLPLKSVGTLLL
jgi:hypothetical protein